MGKSRRSGVKSWFVEPYKQVKLGLMFLLVNGVFAFLIIGVFGYYVYEMYDVVTEYFRLSGAESMMTARKFFVPMTVGGSLILLFIITTILVSVRYTHEIYGPLVSIHRYLDDILTGRVPGPIQLRESDQLKDLADKLNSVAERVGESKRAGAMMAIHRFLDEAAEGKTPEPIRLRDGDPLSELAGKLNALMSKSR